MDYCFGHPPRNGAPRHILFSFLFLYPAVKQGVNGGGEESHMVRGLTRIVGHTINVTGEKYETVKIFNFPDLLS